MAAPVDQLAQVLKGAKFKADNQLRDRLDAEAGEHPEYAEATAEERARGASPAVVRGGTGMRLTGPYEVLGAWRAGEVTVVVEQNTDQGGTHDPVAVIEGPNGFRVACDPNDTELVKAEAAAAGGDFSLMEQRDVASALARAGFQQDSQNPGQWVRNGIRLTGLMLMMLPGILLGRLLGLVWFVSPSVVTNATKKAWLDAWYSATALGAPSTVHFGLSTTTPAEDGTNVTEPSGNAYARVAKTAGTTDFPASTAADPTVKTNGTTITWPAATGSWGTVTHCTQHSASTGGSVQDWQALGASQAIGAGTTASIAASSWQSTLT